MARYQVDFEATGRWMRTDGDLRRACEEAAEDVADIARAIAPVDTGAFRGSIETFSMSGTDRVGAGVEATNEAAAPLEFGNRRTVEQDILTNAAEAVGLDVRYGRDL